jgi:hypothetical protein
MHSNGNSVLFTSVMLCDQGCSRISDSCVLITATADEEIRVRVCITLHSTSGTAARYALNEH